MYEILDILHYELLGKIGLQEKAIQSYCQLLSVLTMYNRDALSSALDEVDQSLMTPELAESILHYKETHQLPTELTSTEDKQGEFFKLDNEKCHYVNKELLSTEQNFIVQLRLLESWIRCEIEQGNKRKDLFSRLNEAVKTLISTHQTMYKALKISDHLFETVAEFVPSFKERHLEFFIRYIDFHKQSKKIKFVSHQYHRIPFNSLLIAPIQRITRYHLLYQSYQAAQVGEGNDNSQIVVNLSTLAAQARYFLLCFYSSLIQSFAFIYRMF